MPILLQINVVANSGSTGHIAEELGRLVISKGWESYIAYGRWACPSQSRLIRIGNKWDILLHWLKSFLFDRHGSASSRATRNLIKQIEKINPDIIHLHNIHGYYLNYNILFNYLSKANVPTLWTLHDCWSMTGHCVHFQDVNCLKWKSLCYDCPHKRHYPESLFIDNSTKNYLEKKRRFSSYDGLTIIPVCGWLDNIVSSSFLKNCNRQVIVNGIDLELFSPFKGNNDIRIELGIKSEFMILGIATAWKLTKGFDDIIRMRKMLPNSDVIVLIGLSKKQIKYLPNGIIGVERTEDVKRLTLYYSAADVFINPTYQDTLPTVNIEALACGTPVVTYNTGGCANIVDARTGVVVKQGDLENFVEAVNQIKSKGKSYYSTSCRNKAVDTFDKIERYKDYWDLYLQLTNRKANL